MTESPDLPWAKDHDNRIKPKINPIPSPAALFFYDFIKSRGTSPGGKLVDLGCGNGRNSIYFAEEGFEVHAIDQSDAVLKDIDLHGVMPHCHSVTEFWLFEDTFFDFAIDIFCYSEQTDEEKKKFYRSELFRVLKQSGFYLLSVPSAFTIEQIKKEFVDFEVLASKNSNDEIYGKPIEALNLILRKR